MKPNPKQITNRLQANFNDPGISPSVNLMLLIGSSDVIRTMGMSLLKVRKRIIHLFPVIGRRVVLAQRADSLKTWGPLSETWESGDPTLRHTAKRGALEELGMHVIPGNIISTGFRFKATSPKGTPILGESFYTSLEPSTFSTIKLNEDELADLRLVKFDDAMEMIGHPEAIAGLKHLKTHFNQHHLCQRQKHNLNQ